MEHRTTPTVAAHEPHDSMRLTVAGAWTYTVRLVDGRVDDLDEGDVLAVSLNTDREIRLSTTLTVPEARLDALQHQYVEAWLFHVVRPLSQPMLCQLVSTIMSAFRQTFAAAGGEEALMRLRPTPAKETPAVQAAAVAAAEAALAVRRQSVRSAAAAA